jgi:hypothetical protein
MIVRTLEKRVAVFDDRSGHSVNEGLVTLDDLARSVKVVGELQRCRGELAVRGEKNT